MRTPQSVARAPRRPGLTLIELIVVMMILIALVGVLAPMLPGMLSRAHNSTCPTNIAESARAIETYQQLYNTFPNNWDALSDGTTMIDYFANGAALPANIPPSNTNGPGNGEVSQSNLTVPELAALNAAGIFTVQGMVATPSAAPGDGAPFDPTFNYYTGATAAAGAIPITGTTALAFLDPTNTATPNAITRCTWLNLPLTGRYVLLGIGPRTDMIGKTVQTPGVHFGDTPVLNPEYGYTRFAAIFKVSDSTNPNFSTAQLVGVAPIMDNGLGGIQDHLQSWYQSTNGGS